MDADRSHQLISGTSGAAYAKAVLMSQSEATNYGLHVAKILAQLEPDADRAQAMERMCDKWSKLHAEASKLNG